MKRTLHCLILVTCIIGVPACRGNISPIISGDLSFQDHDGINRERALTQEQLHLLSNWFEEHTSGWKMNLKTDPIPDVICRLRHADGQSSSLLLFYLRKESTWSRTVNLCGLDRRDCVVQSFSDQDVSTLRQLLGLEL